MKQLPFIEQNCTWIALEIYKTQVGQDRNCNRKSCLLNCW